MKTSNLYEAFRKYAVHASGLEDFCAKYHRRDRYAGRGKEYMEADLASHREDLEKDGFTIIPDHDSVTGRTVAYYGSK